MSKPKGKKKQNQKTGIFAIVLHISIMKVTFLPLYLMTHDFFLKEELSSSRMLPSHWVLKEVK